MSMVFKDDFFRVTGKKYSFYNFFVSFVKNYTVRFIYFYRNKNKFVVYNFFYKRLSKKNGLEIESSNIGKGLYIGHPYCITVNPKAIIGKNCNLHKGVTIGQENRGIRKGAPHIGDNVWIGVNSTIVGNIEIGDDVLISANSFVNCNVPSHSIVVGNPCKIYRKQNATENYINNRV